MNTWKVILATMVIFGAGVVTGGLLVHHEHIGMARPPHLAGVPRPTVPASPGVMRLEFLRRAQRELDLAADQRERVDKILKESQERTRKLVQPIAPQLNEESRRAREAFLGVLTPEQRARFEEMVKQQQQQHPHDQHRSVPSHGERTLEAAVPTNAP